MQKKAEKIELSKNALKVKQLRAERGWSQLDLAIKAEVSRGTIQNIETGKNSPKDNTLGRLFKVLEGPQSAGGKGVGQKITVEGVEMNDPILIDAKEVLNSGTEYGAALAQNIRAFLRAVRHERGNWGQESHPRGKPEEDTG